MFTIHLDRALVNSILRKAGQQKVEFRDGHFSIESDLPIGSVEALVVPSFKGAELVLSIPFTEIKGNLPGGFLLTKLLGTFWGTISKQVEKFALPRLDRMGLPRDSLSLEKKSSPAGDVGTIRLSVKAVNRWLAGRHPRLAPELNELKFSPQGVEVIGTLREKTLS